MASLAGPIAARTRGARARILTGPAAAQQNAPVQQQAAGPAVPAPVADQQGGPAQQQQPAGSAVPASAAAQPAPAQQGAGPAPAPAPAPAAPAPAAPCIQSIKAPGIPIFGCPEPLAGPVALHLGSVVGTGDIQQPVWHVVREINPTVGGGYVLVANDLVSWDTVVEKNKARYGADTEFFFKKQHLELVKRQTQGLDEAQQLFATGDTQTLQLQQVCCIAVLWDCGNLRRLAKNAVPPAHVFWIRADVDEELDVVSNVDKEAKSIVYNRTLMTSEISCAVDLEALTTVLMDLRAKKQKNWRASHGHPRYVKREVVGGQVTYSNGNMKFLLVTGVPAEVGLLIARILNAKSSGTFGNLYTAKLGQHFDDPRLLDLLAGALWDDIRVTDALGRVVKLVLHAGHRALVEWRWNGVTLTMALRLPYIRIFLTASGEEWSPDLDLGAAAEEQAPPTPGPAPGPPPAAPGMGRVSVRVCLWDSDARAHTEIGTFEVPVSATLHELRFTYLQTRPAPETLQHRRQRWMSYVQFCNGTAVVPRSEEEMLRVQDLYKNRPVIIEATNDAAEDDLRQEEEPDLDNTSPAAGGRRASAAGASTSAAGAGTSRAAGASTSAAGASTSAAVAGTAGAGLPPSSARLAATGAGTSAAAAGTSAAAAATPAERPKRYA